jgi:peroxin-2
MSIATDGDARQRSLQCLICVERSLSEQSSNPTRTIEAQNADLDAPPRFLPQIPYVTSCGHTYCYVCLYDRVVEVAEEDNALWKCPNCQQPVTNISRVHEDTLGNVEDTMSDVDTYD